MAISTMDGLIAALPGQHRHFYKDSATSEGAGTWQSLWKTAGFPAAGATPPVRTAGSGYTPTDATAGAFNFTNPSGAQLSYLGRFATTMATIGTLILYDRLWHCSGFDCTVVGPTSVTTPGTIPARDANGAALGADCELWGEFYTAPGATAATFTVSYTDQDGNAGNSATYAHPANAETANQMVPFVLATGDTGVRAVASLTLSISTGTAGDFGLTILRRVAEIPIALANGGDIQNALSLGMPRIYDDSCLAMMVQCSTTSTGAVLGGLSIVQG